MRAEAYDDLLAMMDGLDVLTIHTPLLGNSAPSL